MSLMACVVISRASNHIGRSIFNRLAFSQVSPLGTMASAAPNVVVYTADNESKYNTLSKMLEKSVSSDSLAVYQLSRLSLLKNNAAWRENVRGLVVDNLERLSRDEAAALVGFFRHGGRILDLGSNFGKHLLSLNSEASQTEEIPWNELTLTCKDHFDMNDFIKAKANEDNDDLKLDIIFKRNDKIFVIDVAHPRSGGKAILSRFPFYPNDNCQKIVAKFLKRLSVLPGNYKETQPVVQSKRHAVISVFGKNSKLVLDNLNSVSGFEDLHRGKDSPEGFESDKYFSLLQTRSLGRTVLYQPICPTTMDVVKQARQHFDDSSKIGLISVADRQTSGVGRAGNKWLSPEGCTMFTFDISVGPDSGLGKRIPLVQSLAALSCVEAINEHCGLDSGVKIKWPNDIYHGNTKIGGILVHSTMVSGKVSCSIGIGINMSNQEPTLCLNSIFAKLGVPSIKREQLISGVLNRYEINADLINTLKVDEVVGAYCDNWMHTDQRVVVRDENQTDYCNVPLRRKPVDSNILATPPSSLRSGYIRCIDEFGFLVVEFQDRSRASLHPDGNSFDAMNGLIVPKTAESSSSAHQITQSRLGEADYPRSKSVRGMVYQVR